MKISLITATGGRPEAWTLCKHWITRQTVLQNKNFSVEWIIVDDCDPETVSYTELTQAGFPKCLVLNPEQKWQPGQNTQARNLLLATELNQVSGDIIAIIEDDDWYHPEYLEKMIGALQETSNDMVGEARAIYYTLPQKHWRRFPNKAHSSLCSTVFRKNLLEIFRATIRYCQKFHKPWIDMEFWEIAGKLYNSSLFSESKYVLGIKGLPGRKGIGMGHDGVSGNMWNFDVDLKFLRNYIGEKDLELYKPYMVRRK